MWGKHFESMYEGSMYGAGLAVFAVWGYVLSHAWVGRGRLDLNPKLLANTLGGTEEEVLGAIEYLTSPDPKSHFKANEGRRLVHEVGFKYFVPSWEYYQGVRNDDNRREQNRIAQAKFRERKKPKTAKQVRREAQSREARSVAAQEAGNEPLSDQICAEGL